MIIWVPSGEFELEFHICMATDNGQDNKPVQFTHYNYRTHDKTKRCA